MSEKNDFASEAWQAAAQCWCDQNTSYIPMDANLCKAVARRIQIWMQTAAQHCNNELFYMELLDKCAEHLGPDVYVSDDGSVQQDPIRLKIPEMVKALAQRPAHD